jgi:predicted aldo/keto reductase-like oxidoreductase
MALSGMSSLSQLEENVETASRDEALSAEEISRANDASLENQRMMDLYCTGCKYCEPCPEAVNIPEIFKAMNYYQVWDLKRYAIDQYQSIGSNQWLPGKRADACTECGSCEDKCPQHLPIRERLKECAKTLGVSNV